MRRSLIGLLALSFACDPPSPAEDDGGSSSSGSTTDAPTSNATTTSSTTDASTSDDGSSTSHADTSSSTSAEDSSSTGTPACDGLVPGDAFEIAAGDSDTRIHPHAAADANGAWITYVRPQAAGSNFEVALTHIRCATEADVPPMVVNTEPGNHIDPSVAVSGDRVLVVWNTDDGQGGSSNLQIHYRTFDLEGMPLDEGQQRLTTAVEGVDITQNHTFGTVTARDDGFTVAGLRAHPQSPAFVAFAQVLDLDGAFVGEAVSAPIVEGASHLNAAALGDWMIYHRSDDAESVRSQRLSNLDEGPSLFDARGGSFVLPLDDDANLPMIAGVGGSDTNPDLVVHFGGNTLPLGTAAPDHNPSLASSGEDLYGLVFHRNNGGLDNDVVVQRLSSKASATRMLAPLGDELVLDDNSPPYPPSITWIGTGWLVTWARGEQSPNFTTWGRVLEP